ncbi:MAG: hypothetical protein JST80_04770 [Bdellovibrionales bacterium]|nr:hypothetical protein [Bdellovibrionales bacterium]
MFFCRLVKKLVCKANEGKIQGIVGIVVTPSDLEGQLIAMTTAKSGAVSFFVSNGSVEDASIQVGAYRWPSNGDYALHLNRSVDEKGNLLASLDETFICDPSASLAVTSPNRSRPFQVRINCLEHFAK